MCHYPPMSKAVPEFFLFDEQKLADEMGVPLCEVTVACTSLHREREIVYIPPRFGIDEPSKARLPDRDWRYLYGISDRR